MRFRFFFIGMAFVFLQFPLSFALAQQDGTDSASAGAVDESEIPDRDIEGESAAGESAGEVPDSPAPELPATVPETAVRPPPPAGQNAGAAGAVQGTAETAPPAQPGTEIAGAVTSVEDTLLDIGEAAEKYNVVDWLEKIGVALAIIAGQALLIWVIWAILFKKIAEKVFVWGRQNIKPLTIKKLKLLSTQQIINVIQFFLRIFKYLVTVFQLFITLPIIFSLFPATQNLASTLFGY
ncbi:MAG: hypothetical protein LBP80_07530, partial [Treponema sp.]|nr:hypothetical protein [Treponema sp.]